MSVHKGITFHCDICAFPSMTFVDVNSKEAKTILRSNGWRFRGGVHRCMTCVTNANLTPQHPTDEATDEGAGEE